MDTRLYITLLLLGIATTCNGVTLIIHLVTHG